jgi:mono/diheme cytochrome c family protein
MKRETATTRIRWMIAGAMIAGLLAAAGGLAIMHSGIYNVAASSQHTRLVHWMLEQGMHASVRNRAASTEAPASFDAATLRRGAQCFHVNCVQCHGGPGQAPAEFAGGFLPTATSLVHTAHRLPVEQVYWITRNGIRLTAMPAWEYRLDDSELWAVAAFVDRELPQLTAQQYRERIAEAGTAPCARPATRSPPDAARGLVTMRQYGCQGCHVIPGITGAEVHVGPSLRHFAGRPLLAGALPNTPDNVVRWLLDPQALRPRTLMPDLHVTEQHALDMQAYLATLE